jgi:hypothetical protein
MVSARTRMTKTSFSDMTVGEQILLDLPEDERAGSILRADGIAAGEGDGEPARSDQG